MHQTRVTAESVDACSLLTGAEIVQVLKLPVGDERRDDTGVNSVDGSYSSTCFWSVDADQPLNDGNRPPHSACCFVILNVIRWPPDSNSAGRYLQGFKEAAATGDIPQSPVKREFGDEALWWGDGLAVRVRDSAFGISVVVPRAPEQRPGKYEEQLAPLIVARLNSKLAAEISAHKPPSPHK